MGEIADAMLNGDLCSGCGVLMGDGNGSGFEVRCKVCKAKLKQEIIVMKSHRRMMEASTGFKLKKKNFSLDNIYKVRDFKKLRAMQYTYTSKTALYAVVIINSESKHHYYKNEQGCKKEHIHEAIEKHFNLK